MSAHKLRKLLVALESPNRASIAKRAQLAHALEALIAERKGSASQLDGELLLRVASALASVQREQLEALRRRQTS